MGTNVYRRAPGRILSGVTGLVDAESRDVQLGAIASDDLAVVVIRRT